MDYQSTRNSALTADSAQAVLQGIAPDGGLYIADPAKLDFDWKAALECDARGMSERILHALLPDFPDMKGIVERSYKDKFETEDLTPTVQVGDRYVLELFRGPTSAFKDVALSVLPQLVTEARKLEDIENSGSEARDSSRTASEDEADSSAEDPESENGEDSSEEEVY